MSSTEQLISELSRQARPHAPLASAGVFGGRLVLILAAYGSAAQWFLGVRPDVAAQFSRPFFVGETLLLAGLTLSSAVAAVLAMYPDAYQKPKFLAVPYALLALLAGMLGVQFLLPQAGLMVMPQPGAHGMECALCIASVALIPSALIFSLMRRGASIRPFQSGSFAVLAAAGLGCLTLRLAEENDSLMHLIGWHYLPTLGFAVLGAMLGRWFLKW